MPSEENADTQLRRRAAFIDEARQIEHVAESWSKAQSSQGRWWRRTNTLLTVVASVIAAVAGGTILANSRYTVLAGVSALVAAALSAAASGLGAAGRSTEFYSAASANLKLAAHARVFRTTIVQYVPMEQATRSFDSLCDERDKVIADSPLKLGVWNMSRFDRAMAMIEGNPKQSSI